MRTVLGIGLGLVLALSCGVLAADDKIDAKKLVGKWEPKDKKGTKFVIEFTKDGKVSISAGEDKKDFKAEGTYKLDGNKIMMTIKFGDKEDTMTRIISKLTDTELTSKDEKKGDEDTLLRIVEKKEK